MNETGVDRGKFEYHSSAGHTAILDLSNGTITYSGGVIHFSDCSDEMSFCFESSQAKIVVPKSCSGDHSFDAYVSSSKELELIGLEGLSGNIWKSFTKTNKFAYAYNPRTGIVRIIIIPESVDVTTKDASNIPEYTYWISPKGAPLACM